MLVYDQELDEKVCNHEDAYLERRIDNEDTYGSIYYTVVCPAENCTGVDEWDSERLYDYLVQVEEY